MKFPIEQTFKLSEGFIEKYRNIKPKFGFGGLGEFVFMRCVTVDTPILCSDFVWRKAGDMKRGDEIISFDEFPDEKTKERYVRLGKITHNKIERANVLGIKMEDGEILYCTPEHRWLAKTSRGLQWVYAKDLLNTKSFEISLPKWADVTYKDDGYMSGYLAGAFDGEASLDRSVGINFVQVENEMLENVKEFLDYYGFDYTFKKKNPSISLNSFKSNKEIYNIILYRKEQLIKFFSLVQPKRLISNFTNKIKEGKLSLRMEKSNYVRVIDVFDAGEKNIAVISTSTKTHFTSGYPSHNTYSRLKENGKNEAWHETVRRVVEGIYSIQKQHIDDYSLGWNQSKAQKSAQEMYDRIFNFKMLGSGRALWALGTDVVMKRGLTESLYNCSFISTQNIEKNFSEPFCNAMDFLMLGVGVGFDIRGENKITIKGQSDKENIFLIPDSREGWIESLRLLLESFNGGKKYVFDYTLIRAEGTPIKTFGGISSGYKPLEELHLGVSEVLNKNIGKEISSTTIADIINMIGRAVVSGNVRRSAELLVGNTSEEFLELKNYEKNPERINFGWASNNSILAEIGMDYSKVAEELGVRGEPGILWLSNMRKYGRMKETEGNNKDFRVIGVNP